MSEEIPLELRYRKAIEKIVMRRDRTPHVPIPDLAKQYDVYPNVLLWESIVSTSDWSMDERVALAMRLHLMFNLGAEASEIYTTVRNFRKETENEND